MNIADTAGTTIADTAGVEILDTASATPPATSFPFNLYYDGSLI